MQIPNFVLKNRFLFLLLLLALVLRLYSISNNHIFFFFDQARDAVISTRIITQKDFKIQGPSVSGTNDSVYHGVLYYYVIAPVYALSQGSPFAVSAYLSVLSLIGIFVTYQLGTEVFKSKTTGLIAALLQSVSVISIHQSTWLSNPTLSALFVPLTYYFIWKLFLSEKKQGFLIYALFGLSIALAMQSALQNITIFGSVLLVFLFSLFTKSFKFELKKILVSVVTFFVGISTMLLTEFLMYKRGILSFESLNLSQHETSIFSVLPQIASKYFSVISDLVAPQKFFIFPAILVLLLLIYISRLNKKQVVWAISFLTAPIWLLIWHYRDPNHTFIGVEVIVFLLLAVGLTKILKQKNLLSKLIVGLVILVFVFSNFKTLNSWRVKQHHYFGIQNGAFLNNQLSVVNKTYELANGNEFSISTLTSPYLINTTWDYLYQWYGQSRYGYTPFYVGIDQKYFITDSVLAQKYQPEKMHFIIFEPDTTLSEEIQRDFIDAQYETFGPYSSQKKYEFGSLKLEQLVQ